MAGGGMARGGLTEAGLNGGRELRVCAGSVPAVTLTPQALTAHGLVAETLSQGSLEGHVVFVFAATPAPAPTTASERVTAASNNAAAIPRSLGRSVESIDGSMPVGLERGWREEARAREAAPIARASAEEAVNG